MEKECRTCHKLLDISYFYRHGEMKDGHLNICIDCTKERVFKHRISHIDKIREYDRKRGVTEERKQKNVERYHKIKKEDPDKFISMNRNRTNNYRQKYKNKQKAVAIVQRNLLSGKLKRIDQCEVCGINKSEHAHHEDYSKPLDILWVCIKCHGYIHRKKREEARNGKNSSNIAG